MNMLDRDFAPKYTELDVILAFNKIRHDLEDELNQKKKYLKKYKKEIEELNYRNQERYY